MVRRQIRSLLKKKKKTHHQESPSDRAQHHKNANMFSSPPHVGRETNGRRCEFATVIPYGLDEKGLQKGYVLPLYGSHDLPDKARVWEATCWQ